MLNSPFFKHAISVMNLLPTMTRKQKIRWGYECETCAAFMSASVKHVVLLYFHRIVMWLCKFSFIPHSCWLPDNLFLSWALHWLIHFLSITAWSLVMECHVFPTLTQNWKCACKKHLHHLFL